MASPRPVRWGLISDVHGNLPALQRALEALRSAEHLAFLGDYLGRGDSDGCVRLIQSRASVAILGNRDLDWQHRVSAASRAWVLSLPRTAVVDDILLSHGDARLTPGLDTGQARRDFAAAVRQMQAVNASIFAFGHSHAARTWCVPESGGPATLLPDSRVSMQAGQLYVVNVGTTGLPFPGKGGPSVALVDLAAGSIQHLPVPK